MFMSKWVSVNANIIFHSDGVGPLVTPVFGASRHGSSKQGAEVAWLQSAYRFSFASCIVVQVVLLFAPQTTGTFNEMWHSGDASRAPELMASDVR